MIGGDYGSFLCLDEYISLDNVNSQMTFAEYYQQELTEQDDNEQDDVQWECIVDIEYCTAD